MSAVVRPVLGSVVVLGFCFVAMADTELKPSRAVTLHLKTGKTVTGILIRAGVKEVEVRMRPGQPSTRYQRTAIESIHVRDEIYRFNETTIEWERSTEKEKPKTPDPKSAPEKEKSKTVAPTQTVVGEGVGATAEEARKDAIREAVRKVAGALVIGETTVENDKVIKDKVLTYSDGVIAQDSYKELERKKEGDIWRVLPQQERSSHITGWHTQPRD